MLAALSSGPSAITGGLDARDTTLMRDALRALGVTIEEQRDSWLVTPPERFTAGGTVDCGLAGTVMRFVPPIAALADGEVCFDGDQQAYGRPMEPLLGALSALGAPVEAMGGGDPTGCRSPITGDPGARAAARSPSMRRRPASSSPDCCWSAPAWPMAWTCGTRAERCRPRATSR